MAPPNKTLIEALHLRSTFSRLLMRILLTVIFLSLAIGLSAQTNQTDAQGRKQGEWKKYYDNKNTQLRYQGQFKDDVPVGTFIYYHENGKQMAETVFQGNTGNSYTKLFDETGKLMGEGPYIGQQRDGLWKFYNEKGKLIQEERYNKGIKNGVWTTYYADGKIAEMFSYVNDSKEGEWIQNYPDGLPKTQGAYLNNILQGPCVYFDQEGRPLMKGSYNAGLKTGAWLIYEDGTLIAKEEYRHGTLKKSTPIKK